MSCGFYEKLQSWFQQAKYDYTITNSIFENTNESVNIEGEIIIETIEGSGQSLDVMNQIIMILLPLMVTLIALSFALLPNEIYGVKYGDLRRLGINRAYSFLDMIIISIVLFTSCIVFYYLDFVLCTILIDFIALVYIALFLCLEIPLLSQSRGKINHIIKNSIDNEYVHKYKSQEKKPNDDKRIIDTFVYNKIGKEDIKSLYFDTYKKEKKQTQEYANRLFRIYAKKMEKEYPYESIEVRRRLVSDFCNNYIECIKIYGSLNISFSKYSYEYINDEVKIIWNFLNNYIDINNEYNRNDLRRMLLFVNCHGNIIQCASVMRQTNLLWLYDSTNLYKIGITNALLMYTLFYENISFLDVFVDVYLGDLSTNLEERPDWSYLVFFSIYLFQYSRNNKSKKLEEFQNKMYMSPVYKSTMENSLYLSNEADGYSFYFVTLLKQLLDFYKTLPEDNESSIHCINWEDRPSSFVSVNKFVPFTKDDLCNWWITFILVSSIKDIDKLEKTLKDYLNSEELKILTNAYHKNWVNTKGNLKQVQQFNAYFSTLNVSTNVSEDKKDQIKKILDNLCNKEIQAETKVKNSNSGETSLAKDQNDTTKSFEESKRTKSEKKTLAQNSELIKNYVNEHATKHEFYSNEKPSSIQKTSFVVYFSKEGSIIDGFYPPHYAFSLLFDESGYYNVHDRYLLGDMNQHFEKSKSLSCYDEINEYTEEINEKITKFKPDKKFAPYSKWMLDSSVSKKPSSYRKIVDVENTKTNLLQDTYLKNGAIKFYIKCINVSNISTLNATSIKSMIQNGEIRYNRTSDGKYIYKTQTLEGKFSVDELTDLLKGNIKKVTVTMEYGVTYDESKMLVYRIVNN